MRTSFVKVMLAACVAAVALLGCGGSGGVALLPLNSVLRWDKVLCDANALDHTNPGGSGRPWHQQAGPGKTARAFAIVHIAMFDAANSISRRYHTYSNIADAPTTANIDAAVSQAAHDTLVSVYPGYAATFDAALATELAAIPNGQSKADGITAGQTAAAAILLTRSTDNLAAAEAVVYVPTGLLGHWSSDPINPGQQALNPGWGLLTPFAMTTSSQFRCPPPPTLTSSEYTQAFNEVKALGGDGVTTPTTRTTDQTEIGLYWAYDGTNNLGTPPRLYNQIATRIALDRNLDLVECSRLFALIDTSMADAGIGCWEAKYVYDFWRPVTALRTEEGNGATANDPTYLPLCAPNSNNNGGNNFTPGFPAYPSGHATFGGALFESLRNYFGTDNVPFTFVSDELNGITTDNHGTQRVYSPRTFTNLSTAEEENGQSRIYLGIHWAFDKTAGIDMGRSIADWVFTHKFLPR